MNAFFAMISELGGSSVGARAWEKAALCVYFLLLISLGIGRILQWFLVFRRKSSEVGDRTAGLLVDFLIIGAFTLYATCLRSAFLAYFQNTFESSLLPGVTKLILNRAFVFTILLVILSLVIARVMLSNRFTESLTSCRLERQFFLASIFVEFGFFLIISLGLSLPFLG
jgi:hypothetical protein